jgi:hypothetical protein
VLQGAGNPLASLLYKKAALAYSSLAEAEAAVEYTMLDSAKSVFRIKGWNSSCSTSDLVQPIRLEFAGSNTALRPDE